MTLASLKPTQHAALLALVGHGTLRRRPGGYVPPSPGVHVRHSMRAVFALVRAGLAEWGDDQVHAHPTAIGRALVRDATIAAQGGRIDRSAA